MNQVLVTGATGLVGEQITKRLSESEYAVHALGRRTSPQWVEEFGVEYIQGDIRNTSLIQNAVSEVDTIVHLAARTEEGSWDSFYDITVRATKTLLNIAVEQGGKRVIVVSSLGNYEGAPMQQNVTIDEGFPLERDPEKRPHYARAKTLQDELAQEYLDSEFVDLTVVRPGVVLADEIENPLLGAAFPLNGIAWLLLDDGTQDYPFIHVRDVVKGILRVINNDQTIGEIYNLVSPGVTTRNDAVAAYQENFDDERIVLRLHLSKIIKFFELADFVDSYLPGPHHHFAYQLSRYVATVTWSGSKIEKHTDWAPEMSIEETYRDIANA